MCVRFELTIVEENICISWWYRYQIDARDEILSKKSGKWRIEGLIACKERREGKYSLPAKFLDNCSKNTCVTMILVVRNKEGMILRLI
jgi:hypothetical protein